MSELCLSKVGRLDYGNIQIWDLKGYFSLFHALLFWYVLRSLIWVKSDFILVFVILKFHVKAKKKGEEEEEEENDKVRQNTSSFVVVLPRIYFD